MSDPAGRIARVRALLDELGLAAVLLESPASIAWLTGGGTGTIDRSAAADPLAIAVSRDKIFGLAMNVEIDRLRCESRLSFSIEPVRWHGPETVAGRAAALLGQVPAPEEALADELAALRLPLSPEERERVLALGGDAARAVEAALATWTPGDTDRALAAAIAGACEARGIAPVCLIVGGDDRLARFRHPLPIGAPIHHQAMAVLVGARQGLHVALTRHAAVGPPGPLLAAGHAEALAIEAAVLDACTPGATYGDALAALARAYGDDRWSEHWQGGPIGYRQREFEVGPTPRTRWHDEPIALHHAVAWNPSVAGGGKSEDTFVLAAGGPVCVTATGGWPTVEVAGRLRHAILER